MKKLVVIGASMGGLSALKDIVRDLPQNLPASLVLVQHIAGEHTSRLPDILHQFTDIPCLQPANNEPVEAGKIYCAPGGKHLLIMEGQFILGKGKREKGARPSINHLFRSAALQYKEKVIGVVLTGLLQDGTEGLQVIRDQGGTTIVQDPGDAEYDEMPRNALRQLEADFVLPLEKIGQTIDLLMGQVKVKARLKDERIDREKMLMALKDESNRQLTPSFTEEESLLALIQLMQERSNMLEQLTEEYMLKEKKSMAKMYHRRLLEARAHLDNLDSIYHGNKLSRTG